jgi:isoamylase
MHVDGFRFDLAPILGEKDLSYNDWDDPKNTVLQEVIDDPILQQYNTRVIAEPWAAGGYNNSCGDPSAAAFGGVRISCFPSATSKPGTGWGEWNGRFRDWWRSFVNDDNWKLNSTEVKDGGFFMTGSYDWFHWNGRRPYNSINFVTVHDGFTLYDLFSYNQKQNLCGPLNPICCDQPTSPFCDTTSGESNNRSRDWGQNQEPFKRQLMRDLFVAMIVSQGTPMLLGGDEWMRTQLGNNNAYSASADNAANWFDWGAWEPEEPRLRMHDFVRKAIALRKAHAYALAPAAYGGGAGFAWKDAFNNDLTNWGVRHLMQHYYDTGSDPQLLVLINMETTDVEFTLPQGVLWLRLADTQQYFDDDAYFTSSGKDPKASANIDLETPEAISGTYTAKSRSIVILKGT